MTLKFLVVSSRLGEKTQKAGSWWRELAAIGGARGEEGGIESLLDEGAGVIFKEQEFAALKFLVVLE